MAKKRARAESADAGTKQDTFLEVPVLQINPIVHPVGRIFHTLISAGKRDVARVEEMNVTKKRKAMLYLLSDGQKVVVTTQNKLQRPDGVDGVLHIGEKTRWLSHRLLDNFNTDHSTLGLERMAALIRDQWVGTFTFKSELRDNQGKVITPGLRPPQIGGLHAIGAHWSLSKQPATVVMPTGTGKTEIMLSTLVAYRPQTVLIVVPSRVLRDQTTSKLETLGLLRQLGNLVSTVPNPIVGYITKRPRSTSDLDIFDKCNVVVSTMSIFAEATAMRLVPAISKRVDALIVDEAHHIAADGWSQFREHFAESKVLQFTATPYRRDGKLVDGKVIFEYPLHLAQKDGYFKKIAFQPIYELDQDDGDVAIANSAIKQLQKDASAKLHHSVMARCSNIERATKIYQLYKNLAPEFNPVLMHADSGANEDALESLRSGASRIVVCVNMLGEGFDLPQLKIAAVHDSHKSLAVLLQFTGRFTRTAGDNIGDATVIANIADSNVSSALERLYSEDANWNQLLSEFSSEASKAHAALVNFLNESQRIDGAKQDDSIEISHHLLHPALSTLVFQCPVFRPKEFFKGIPKSTHVHRVWFHQQSQTLYFVTKSEPPILWTKSRELRDRQWDLFVLHYDAARQLLFLFSNDKTSTHELLAASVGAEKLISGDVIFRSLGRINRLIFQNVGVRKHGRRNLRFAMYTGADVAEALSVAERAGSVKSNLSGTGWENGEPVTIGCSFKGRIWTRDQGTIPEFVQWCSSVGEKLQDQTIDTTKIIANVLIPEEVDALPNKRILSLEWPVEILHQSEEHVILQKGEKRQSISLFDLRFLQANNATSAVEFELISSEEESWGKYVLLVGGDEGFQVQESSDADVNIQIGRINLSVEHYLSNYPPLIRFVDLSELDGNLLIKPQSTQDLVFPSDRFEVWDWSDTDIKKESIWKEGQERQNSIQWKAASQFIAGGFELVFDDDGAGEAADLVCLKEDGDCIRLALIHCKYSKGTTPGERVDDVVQVCSQAVRSTKWKWRFRDLAGHLLAREKQSIGSGRATRFLKGQLSDINKFVKLSRFKPVSAEIVMVQPGLSFANCTTEQKIVLAASHNFMKETIGADLDVICSP